MKEDLHIYMACDFKDNQYYVTTEVPMIRHNKPGSFLPIQIREIDGVKAVYFEITGNCSLSYWADSRKIGYEECRRLLEGVRRLMEDTEEYLLSLNQVNIKKEEIYVDEKGRLLWQYTPFHEENAQKKMEDLLLYLLSVVDYHDREALDLLYHTLHRLKKEGLSRMVQEDLAVAETKQMNPDFYPDPISELPIYGKADIVSKDVETSDTMTGGQVSKKKESRVGNKRLLNTILWVFMAMDLAAFSYLCYCVSIKGATIFLTICLAAVILIFALIFPKCFSTISAKKNTEATDPKPNEIRYDETIFLSLPSCSDKPVLSSDDSGESIEIQVFPFYIGSEAGLNQLSIKNRAVSRQHAVIVRGEDDGYYLKDLNSKNGTAINSKKLYSEETILLKDGDKIAFADDQWVFQHNRK